MAGMFVYSGFCGLLFSMIGPLFVVEKSMEWATVRDVAMIEHYVDSIGDKPDYSSGRSFHIFFEDGEYCFTAYTFRVNKLREMVGKNCEICLCEDVFGTEFILGAPLIEEGSEDFYEPIHSSEMRKEECVIYSLGGERPKTIFFDMLMAVLYNLLPLIAFYWIVQSHLISL